MELSKAELKLAQMQYSQQRKNCGKRKDKNGNPILFKLTFEEWLNIWLESGHYDQRGRCKDSYVMSRYNDLGHYEVGNVIISTHRRNASAGNKGGNKTSFKPGHVISDELRKKISTATKKRWEEYRAAGESKYSGWTKPKVECPHCKKIVAGKRWHFDNCRHK